MAAGDHRKHIDHRRLPSQLRPGLIDHRVSSNLTVIDNRHSNTWREPEISHICRTHQNVYHDHGPPKFKGPCIESTLCPPLTGLEVCRLWLKIDLAVGKSKMFSSRLETAVSRQGPSLLPCAISKQTPDRNSSSRFNKCECNDRSCYSC